MRQQELRWHGDTLCSFERRVIAPLNAESISAQGFLTLESAACGPGCLLKQVRFFAESRNFSWDKIDKNRVFLYFFGDLKN